jgi:SpoIID/LytB domain protein
MTLTPQGSDGIQISHEGNTHLWPVARINVEPTADDIGRAAAFAIDSRRYRGVLEVVQTSPSTVAAVNLLPLEAYVESVVETEMSPSWPEAALEAQAIATRSYAYAHRHQVQQQAGGLLRFHLSSAGDDPRYRGVGSGAPRTLWAASETRGRVLCYRGQPFAAYVHAASGGHTATPSLSGLPDHDNLTALPLDDIMPGRPDPWHKEALELLPAANNRYDNHRLVITNRDLRPLLIDAGYEINWVQRIVPERGSDGRVRQVMIKVVPDDDVVLSGHQFRQLLGRNALPSTLWSAASPSAPEPGSWLIETSGRGHGLGMSQISAFAMARNGHHAREILAFFYPGADIELHW